MRTAFKETIIQFVIFVSMILFFIWFVHSCVSKNDQHEKPSVEKIRIEKQIEYLENTKASDSSQYFIDKLEAEKKLYKKEISQLRVNYKKALDKLKEQKIDTIPLIDTLLQHQDQLNDLSIQYIASSDSIITLQKRQLAISDSIVSTQKKYITLIYQDNQELRTQLDQLNISYLKKEKRIKAWSKIKMALGFGAGLLISSKL